MKIPVKTIQSDKDPTTAPINEPEQDGQNIPTPEVVEENVDAAAQDVDESSVTLNQAEPLEEHIMMVVARCSRPRMEATS